MRFLRSGFSPGSRTRFGDQKRNIWSNHQSTHPTQPINYIFLVTLMAPEAHEMNRGQFPLHSAQALPTRLVIVGRLTAGLVETPLLNGPYVYINVHLYYINIHIIYVYSYLNIDQWFHTAFYSTITIKVNVILPCLWFFPPQTTDIVNTHWHACLKSRIVS